jgi:hypothetical protein
MEQGKNMSRVPLEAEARLNNIYEFRSHLKQNTTLHYYKGQLAIAV